MSHRPTVYTFDGQVVLELPNFFPVSPLFRRQPVSAVFITIGLQGLLMDRNLVRVLAFLGLNSIPPGLA